MVDKRVGCHYCFRTLDSQDTQENHCTFVRCEQCGAIYHEVCWNTCKRCPVCEGEQVHAINIPQPPPLKVGTRKQALSIKPSTIICLQGDHGASEVHRPKTWHDWITYLGQVARVSLVGLILISVSSLISAFTYRLFGLDFITAETVMNAVFRQSVPPDLTFVGAFAVGIIYALVFYSSPHSKVSDESVDRFLKILAGCVTVLALNLILFDVNSRDLVELNIDLYSYEEILYAQGATALSILLLTPLYKNLAPIGTCPKSNLPPGATSLYGVIRMVLVSLLLVLFVVYLAAYRLPSILNSPPITNISLASTKIILTLPMLGAFIMGIAVASVFYWPPKFREVEWRFSVIRLLVTVLCFIAVGLMYRSTPNPTGFLNALIVAAVASFIAIPVQRVLS